jgi:hypothetical protein
MVLLHTFFSLAPADLMQVAAFDLNILYRRISVAYIFSIFICGTEFFSDDKYNIKSITYDKQ